jgi:hypothetical protein
MIYQNFRVAPAPPSKSTTGTIDFTIKQGVLGFLSRSNNLLFWEEELPCSLAVGTNKTGLELNRRICMRRKMTSELSAKPAQSKHYLTSITSPALDRQSCLVPHVFPLTAVKRGITFSMFSFRSESTKHMNVTMADQVFSVYRMIPFSYLNYIPNQAKLQSDLAILSRKPTKRTMGNFTL